ncbi:hypothetical protein MMC29_000192 [Sticta canariensis]|nr:hypothetical protein [Sticta canariensis]
MLLCACVVLRKLQGSIAVLIFRQSWAAMSVPAPQVRLHATTIEVTIGMIKQARIHYVRLGEPQYMDDEDDGKSEQYSRWQMVTMKSCAEMGYIGQSGRSSASAEDLSRTWLKTTAANHCFIWPVACDPDIFDSFVSILEIIRASPKQVKTKALILPLLVTLLGVVIAMIPLALTPFPTTMPQSFCKLKRDGVRRGESLPKQKLKEVFAGKGQDPARLKAALHNILEVLSGGLPLRKVFVESLCEPARAHWSQALKVVLFAYPEGCVALMLPCCLSAQPAGND